MKKIIITGATSMLGTALTEIAVNEGIEVYAVVRNETKRIDRIINSPMVHLVFGSIENLKVIKDIPNDCDVLYHFAWAGTDKTLRDNSLVQERNIKYTLDAVELAELTGCHRFISAGSQAEYGPVKGIIDEMTGYNPVLSYGIAKYAAGILSKKLCQKKGLDHVWGRVFSVYGPHDNEGTMLDYAIKCWLKGEPAKFSSGMQYWNYLYEKDAGQFFFDLGNPAVPPDTYFVANTESAVLRDYIETMMRVFGPTARSEFADSNADSLSGLKVNMHKTISILGQRELVSFEDGIRQMIKTKRSIAP